MKDIKFNRFVVNKNSPCVVMVDAGVNHNNDIQRALEIIDAGADNGADIVKFQTYKASQITTRVAPRYWNEKLNTDNGGSQFDTFDRLDGMGLEGYKEMKKRCIEKDVVFSSTPFNLPDVEILEEIGLDVYKISSSDLTYIDLIREVAKTGKPVIISSGCGTIGEIEKAFEAIHSQGNDQIILQHCILQYPCDDENSNLAKMVKLQEIFPDIPVGYSDHTIGTVIPTCAVALGAKTIEKHFTIDKKLPDSPDHKLSVDPVELGVMVESIRRTEKSIGTFLSGHYPAEEKAWKYARKSLVVTKDIPEGTVITNDMLTCKRPGTGIAPEHFDFIVGRTAKVNISEDTTLEHSMLL